MKQHQTPWFTPVETSAWSFFLSFLLLLGQGADLGLWVQWWALQQHRFQHLGGPGNGACNPSDAQTLQLPQRHPIWYCFANRAAWEPACHHHPEPPGSWIQQLDRAYPQVLHIPLPPSSLVSINTGTGVWMQRIWHDDVLQNSRILLKLNSSS